MSFFWTGKRQRPELYYTRTNCTVLLELFVFIEEDVTKAFMEKGKVWPQKKLQKNPK